MNELRFAARRLRQSSGFAITALLVLAIGIGLNTAIFSVVDALLFRPLPFPHAERIVEVEESMQGFGHVGCSYPNFLDWRRESKTLESASVYRPDEITYTDRATAIRIPIVRVSYGFFNVVGVQPAQGRAFRPEEDEIGAGLRVVITDGFWKQQLGGDSRIVGKNITLDRKPFVVVGVMPPSFTPPFSKADAFIARGPDADRNRGNHGAEAIARLRPGVSLAQANAELHAIGRGIVEKNPDQSGWSLGANGLQAFLTHDFRPVMLTLLAAVGLVLLIACVNLAGLMLVRASGRRRELALRKALGASSWSIVRETLSEAVLLAFAGAAIGVVLGSWSVGGLLSFLPENVAVPHVTLDGRVLLFVLAATCLSALLFGLAPAFRTLNSDPGEALKEGGRANTGGLAGNRLRSALVIVEISLALVIALAAGLVAKSFDHLIHVDAGFEAAHTLTMKVALSGPAYASDDQKIRFWREFLRSAQQKPALGKLGLVSFLPMSDNDTEDSYQVEGRPKPKTMAETPFADTFVVGGDYLRAMDIKLVRGRGVLPSDMEKTPPVIVIDEEFARKNFPGDDPLHHRVLFDKTPRQIVGVVRHVKSFGLDGTQFREQLYIPYTQMPFELFFVTVQPNATEATAISQIRESVRNIDPGIPVYAVRPMTGFVSDSTWRARMGTLLLCVFAGVALVLAAIGLYGVMAYTVAQRTQELGIRLALGATPAGVLRLVLRHACLLSLIGIAIGAVAALAVTGLLRAVLFQVSPSDAGVFSMTALLLAAVGLLAGAIPAIRASHTDPMEAIRYE